MSNNSQTIIVYNQTLEDAHRSPELFFIDISDVISIGVQKEKYFDRYTVWVRLKSGSPMAAQEKLEYAFIPAPSEEYAKRN